MPESYSHTQSRYCLPAQIWNPTLSDGCSISCCVCGCVYVILTSYLAYWPYFLQFTLSSSLSSDSKAEISMTLLLTVPQQFLTDLRTRCRCNSLCSQTPVQSPFWVHTLWVTLKYLKLLGYMLPLLSCLGTVFLFLPHQSNLLVYSYFVFKPLLRYLFLQTLPTSSKLGVYPLCNVTMLLVGLIPDLDPRMSSVWAGTLSFSMPCPQGLA